jgi:hypothetical protein
LSGQLTTTATPRHRPGARKLPKTATIVAADQRIPAFLPCGQIWLAELDAGDSMHERGREAQLDGQRREQEPSTFSAVTRDG